MFIHDRELHPLKAVTRYPDETQGEILFSDEWTKICIVRNPFTRLFSAWFSKVLLRQPGYLQRLPGYNIADKFGSEQEIYQAFEDFVSYLQTHGVGSDPHWDLQYSLLFGKRLSWTKIFTYENLEAELLEESSIFGCEEFRIGKLNISGMAPDWGAVSEPCKGTIAALYRVDLEAYGYASSAPESTGVTDLLPVYVNAVIGRNLRLAQMFERDDMKYQEILQLKEERDRICSERESLNRDLVRAQEEGGQLRKQLEEAKEFNHRLEERKSELNSELDSLLQSNSWKLTAPMRKLRDLFRKSPE